MGVEQMPEKSNPNKEHRKRLKKRFLQEGFDSFEEHNMIELALFYTIPVKDTNKLAHTLIERFGSVAGILDASVEELKEVKGISDHTAIFFHMVAALAKVYYTTESKREKTKFDNADKIGEYFIRKYLGVKEEQVYLLLLDNALSELGCELISVGTLNSASLDLRKVVEAAFHAQATHVVLAHNLPAAGTSPSNEDVIATHYLKNYLEALNIDLLDHVIISGREFQSMKRLEYL